MNTEKRNYLAKKSFSLTLASLILAILLICLNVAAAFIPREKLSADVSYSNMYTLSENTRKFLDSIDEEVVIYVLNPDKSNPQLETFFENYADSSKYIRLEYVNTEKNPDFLTSFGLSNDEAPVAYTVIVKSEKRFYPLSSAQMFYYSNASLASLAQSAGINSEKMSVSEYNYLYKALSSSESYAEYLNLLLTETTLYFSGEGYLSYCVDYVTEDIIPVPYFISGRGEDDTSAGNFASLFQAGGYAYRVHDITTGDIPEDAGCIIINSPKEDYSDSETEAIMKYLSGGGHLLLITGKDNASMKNLMSITDYYGAITTAEFICEEKEPQESGEGEESAETEEPDPYELSTVINIDHDVFALAGSFSATMSKATPITVKPSSELRPSQRVIPIITTGEEAYIGDAANKKTYTLGVAVEEVCENGKTAKLVWLTGAEGFNAANAGNMSLGYPFFAFYWMNETFTSEFVSIPAVTFAEPPLTVPAAARSWIGMLLILFIPAATLGIGAFVYFKRRKISLPQNQ